MPRGYARMVDGNQQAIVAALRGVGCSVLVLGGVIDLACGYRGKTILMDCKNPLGRNRLTARQAALIEEWRGDRIAFVRSVAEALRAVGVEVG